MENSEELINMIEDYITNYACDDACLDHDEALGVIEYIADLIQQYREYQMAVTVRV